MKKVVRVLLTAMALAACFGGMAAQAAVPYKTYAKKGTGEYVETQAAYLPAGGVGKWGDVELNGPQDLRLSPEGDIYIADTGNRRVVALTADGQLKAVIGEGDLQSPRGVFVHTDGRVYVADETRGEVLVYSPAGQLERTFGRPDSPLYGDGNDFKPQKVLVDRAGNLYVISKGNFNGIVQMSPEGEFLAYFGANASKTNLLTILRKWIFTEEQLAKMVNVIPATPANMAIDQKGLVYTVTQGDGFDTLKKLNMAGKNMIEAEDFDPYPAAVAVDSRLGCMYLASQNGYIYEFTREGDLLFVFGGTDRGQQRTGLFKTVTGICVDSAGQLLVLDGENNQVVRFAPARIADLVHEALSLYQSGRYEQSRGPWGEVLRMNGQFDYANAGMGDALYQEEAYEQAMERYYLANDKDGYSEAFWEIRNRWLNRHLFLLVFCAVAAGVLLKLLHGRLKKRAAARSPAAGPGTARGPLRRLASAPFLTRVRYAGYFCRHPADGAYGVRWEGKSSLPVALFLTAAFLVLFVIEKYYSGFLFKSVPEGEYTLLTDLAAVLLVFALVVLCCYLMCEIREGEATFKQLYAGFAYCLTPYFLFQPFLIAASHFLTYNEAFLIRFASVVMAAWIGVLIFLTIKELNGYTAGETVKIVLLTVFTVLIAALVLFLLYLLVTQVAQFVQEIVGEVVYYLEQ